MLRCRGWSMLLWRLLWGGAATARGAGMTIPGGTASAVRFLSGRVFAGFRIYPGSVRFILVITTNPGNLSLHLRLYLSTARFSPQPGDGSGTAARCAEQRWEYFLNRRV